VGSTTSIATTIFDDTVGLTACTRTIATITVVEELITSTACTSGTITTVGIPSTGLHIRWPINVAGITIPVAGRETHMVRSVAIGSVRREIGSGAGQRGASAKESAVISRERRTRCVTLLSSEVVAKRNAISARVWQSEANDPVVPEKAFVGLLYR
jgi:hypothetical protein